MRFLVDRSLLCDAVTNLTRSVATKATFPVLEGIYMIANNDGLNMMGYNLEMGMSKKIDIKCAEEGSVVLNAKLLGEILRKLSEDTVSFEVNDRLVCKIKSGSAVFDIMGMPASDFPEMPTIDDCERVALPCDLLKDMVRETIFATASAEMQKPVLTGLLFDIEEDSLKIVGVDGFRLAIRKEKLNCGKAINFIVSSKTIGEAVKIIKEENEEIEIFVGKRHISIIVDGYTIISRKIEGDFVDYKKIMPTSFSTKINIKTKELINIIERISLIINDQIKTPMRCILENNAINFSCATAVGRATDSYKIDIEGENFEIGFNSKYLLEALKATEADEVSLNFNGPFASVIILPKQGDEFTYMVMPMRLKAD